MKKIETWEDLKKAFENNMLISFEYVVDYGECIILDNAIGFDKDGYPIIYKNINEAGVKIWMFLGIGKKSYQQIHNIIKLMLEYSATTLTSNINIFFFNLIIAKGGRNTT